MTNIYCTLGPSCSNVVTLEAMVLEGLSGVRLNLAHTSLEAEQELIEMTHTAFRHCETPSELIIDLQGPEMRIGTLEEPVEIREGTYIELDELNLPDPIREALTVGQMMLVDDGKILLQVTDADTAFAKRGGIASSHKSVALPGTDLQLPALTEDDLTNIAIAAEAGVTMVMQPFVRSRADLHEVRAALDAAGGQDIALYAKIESLKGLADLPMMVDDADGFVIARGDLGNAVPLWDLPAIQKRIAGICSRAKRPFMVATQLLASMETKPVPTRAEVNDVFNAVLDGAHSLMATGETAVGSYPIEVIKYLANTIRVAHEYDQHERI